MKSLEELRSTLMNARFYGAKSETIDDIQIISSQPATQAGDYLCMVNVSHGNTQDIYQLLLDEQHQDVLGDNATELGAALADGHPAGGGQWHQIHPFPAHMQGRQLRGEQSNTSLIFTENGADKVVLKYFRKLEPGINPEVELLSGMTPTPHIAALYGWVSTTINDQDYITAVAQEFIPNSQDGWKLALSMASAGTSFKEEATQLGIATKSVHQALAEGFGTTDFTAEDVAHKLRSRFHSIARRVPYVQRFSAQVEDFYDSLSGHTAGHRVHGDLHLGQVLRTPDRYVLIDFEGEPARPLSERREPDAAVRDVAGLVRSLDYAARSVDSPDGWAKEATDCLLAGYGVDPSDPFLQAYILDKALYEVAYEVDNRPDWVHIPQAAVEELLS